MDDLIKDILIELDELIELAEMAGQTSITTSASLHRKLLEMQYPESAQSVRDFYNLPPLPQEEVFDEWEC